MERIDLDKDHPSLAELVARAEAGEAVEIMRDGKLAAKITAVEARRRKVDVELLRQLHRRQIASGAKVTESAVVEMRKDNRY